MTKCCYNFFICSFIMLYNYAFPQKQIVFYDDFNANRNRWNEKNTDNVTSILSQSHYQVNHKADGWLWESVIKIIIDHHNDFVISTRFKPEWIGEKYIFGMVWNYKNINNSCMFLWDASGKIAVKKNTDEYSEYIVKWTPVKHKMIKNTYATLSVKYNKNDNLFYYLINEEIVASSKPLLPEYDRYTGFHFQNKGHVQIDNLQLLQDRGEIHVVEAEFDDAKKENLGTKINTVYTEKSPLIAHDGKTLYFVRAGDPNNIGDAEKDDIWYSKLDKTGLWEEAKNMGKPLNNASHNSIIAVTTDHNTAFVKHHYDEAGEYAGQGFSITQRHTQGWQIPQKINIPNYYNKSNYSEATVSPDGKVIIFTAQRNDTHGGKDIYFSMLTTDGTWTEPVNAGSEVNSFGNETGPFIAGDGKTMYFASDGHPGYGDMDIFMSKRLDDSWTKWSTPLNLGKTINTEGWDAYFTVDAKGEWAYMTSNENSIGNLDIFRIKLPQKARPEPVAIIKGHVYNAKTNEPILCEISFHILENDSTLGKLYTNPSDGSFTLILKEGYHYNILANYAGYIAERYNLDLTELSEYTEKETILYLKPIEVNQSITLNNIFFAPDQALLLYESRCELHHIARIMKENPDMHILIGGHTEINPGNEKYYKKLSEDRAKAVYHFLHHNLGVDKKRMHYIGYGSSKPLFNSSDKALNARNRRVDFTIVKF